MDGGHGRPVGCSGALGPCHAHHVRTGLLAHLAQRPQVLHGCCHGLLSSGCRRLLHLPRSRHHTEAISDRSNEPLSLLRVELHDPQMVFPLGLIFLQISTGVCRHQHPQRFLVSFLQTWTDFERKWVFVARSSPNEQTLQRGEMTTVKKSRLSATWSHTCCTRSTTSVF